MKAWVSKLTGLPSFEVRAPGVLKCGDRIVARLLGDGVVLLSDAFAECGVVGKYSYSGAESGVARLSRVSLAGRDGAVVTGLDGRGVAVDLYEDTGDKRSWDSGADEYANGVVRFKLGKRGGESRFWLDDSSRIERLRCVLEGSGLVLIVLGSPAAGVDGVRCVLVRNVDYLRSSTAGEQRVDVKWLEKPVSDYSHAGVGVAPAPVVTWGDCEGAGMTWGPWSERGAAVRLTGGPA